MPCIGAVQLNLITKVLTKGVPDFGLTQSRKYSEKLVENVSVEIMWEIKMNILIREKCNIFDHYKYLRIH